MSHITDIFLLTNCSFDPEYSPKQAETIQKVQDWLKDNCNQQLKRLDSQDKAYGGGRVFQAGVWCGAFNYLGLDDFIDLLKTLDWSEEDEDLSMVQLCYQDEHDTGFTLIDIHGEKEIYTRDFNRQTN